MMKGLMTATVLAGVVIVAVAMGKAAAQTPLTRCAFTLEYGASSGETITVVGRHLTELSLRRVCESMALDDGIAQGTKPTYGVQGHAAVRRCAFVSDQPLPRGYTGKRGTMVNGKMTVVSYPIGRGPVVFTLYSNDATSDPIACSRLRDHLKRKMPSLRQVA